MKVNYANKSIYIGIYDAIIIISKIKKNIQCILTYSSSKSYTEYSAVLECRYTYKIMKTGSEFCYNDNCFVFLYLSYVTEFNKLKENL